MDNTKKLTHLSLCAGYGGIDLGLKLATGDRIRTVAYVEIETAAIENLIAKMEEGRMDPAPVWSDLRTMPWELFRGVDILSGGYPCQPFSAAGKRLGAEDPRHLWPVIANGICLCQPKLCFFENVEGHISLGLSTVVSDLEEMGYAVSWGIFSAAEVGAPHQRKRVFIMAHRDGCGGWKDWLSSQLWTKGTEQPPCNRWPSRPGEAQQEWEEPRVFTTAHRVGTSKLADAKAAIRRRASSENYRWRWP